jgi:hypothetical protein
MIQSNPIRRREDSPTLASRFSNYLDGFTPNIETKINQNNDNQHVLKCDHTLPENNYAQHHHHLNPSHFMEDYDTRWIKRKKLSKREKRKVEKGQGWSLTSILWVVGGVVITIIIAAQIANYFLQPDDIEDENNEDNNCEKDEKKSRNQHDNEEIQYLPSEDLVAICGTKKASNELLRRLKFLEKCTLTKELGEEL